MQNLPLPAAAARASHTARVQLYSCTVQTMVSRTFMSRIQMLVPVLVQLYRYM
jgi:hypothetical protein